MIALVAAALAGNVQLETFDHVVRRVPEVHPSGAMPAAWTDATESLRKSARKAKSATELRPVLVELLESLGASHYAVLPQSWDETAKPMVEAGLGASAGGTAGLAVATLDGSVVVWRVAPGSPAEAAGVTPGTVITAVDGQQVAPLHDALFAHQKPAVADLMLRQFVRSRVDGPVSQSTTITTADGTEVEIGRTSDGVFTAPPIGHTPSMSSVWTEHDLAAGPHAIRYVAFEVFVLPVVKRFEQTVATAREAHAGLIVDLRGNPGGVLGVGRGVAGFLEPTKTSLGQTQAQFGTMDLVVHPRPASQRFEGPVGVLVDGASASTSEILAAGLQASGRARIFGTKTAGMALPSHFEKLPNGDVLQLATGDYITPAGDRIEGRGLEPDTPAALTTTALKSGDDPVLAAALAWLEATLADEETAP